MSKERFVVSVPEAELSDLRERLGRTRFAPDFANKDWAYGTCYEELRELVDYWREQYDWRKHEQAINSFANYKTEIDGIPIHFIHERGKGPAPIPLILTHGWPGSFLEMRKILPLLTDPASHGGDPADSFDVVVPSLPGYGFSDRPTQSGINVMRIADLWAGLMTELGYRRFGAQGGDIGAGVSTALGLRHADRILGIHLNFIPGSFRPFLEPGATFTPVEQEFLDDLAQWSERNGAYSHIQRTTPQTAAYGLNDSPAALAAWILEKFRAWSDCDGDVYRRFSRDELLTNVTLYWMTETIHSSFRLYFENRKAPLHFGSDDFVGAPCAIARFPKEIAAPPRAWVERGYNVQRWSDMPRGGHFAASEEPELLAEELRSFFRNLRH
jgi:pimeloyl-ACP methyl ester carboxylesterase